MHAAGGMGTTAYDAARWLSLQMNGGTIDGKRILCEEMTEASHEYQSRLPEPEGTIRIMKGFGYGWMLGEFNGMRLAQHGGGYLGTATYFAMLPEEGVGVVVLINSAPLGRMLGDIIAVDMLCELTGTEPAWDVYGNWSASVTRRKAQQGPTMKEKGGGPFPVETLSHDRAAYIGTYTHPMLGTVSVVPDGQTIQVNVGKVVSRFQPGEATDHFLFDGPVFDGTRARFELEGGRAVRMVMIEERLGELVFERDE